MKVALVVLLALALVAGLLWVLQPWDGGIELTYAFRGKPEEAVKTRDVLSKRLRACGIRGSVASSDDRVQVRVASQDQAYVESRLRRILERPGRLEIRVAADRERQERFLVDPQVPPGFIAMNVDLGVEQHGTWYRGLFLASDPPEVRTADVSGATAAIETSLPLIHLRLPPGAAARLRAELLVARLDDEYVLMRTPEIRPVDEFWLEGLKDFDFPEWVFVLAGGELPVPLGTPEVGRYRGRLR